MDPTSILALEANGTDLEKIDGFGNGSRVVFPCRWGYKWVRWVEHITVIDYVYKGNDSAMMPNCTKPSTIPPVENCNDTGLNDYMVRALSNSTIESFRYSLYTRLSFDIRCLPLSSSYFYVVFPKALLTGPYQVHVDGRSIATSQTETENEVYVYFMFFTDGNSTTIEIESLTYVMPGGFGGGGSRPLYIDH
jgi:hypothetical protein